MSARVLVVDDIEQNRKLLSDKLKNEYFHVITAVDGEDGVEKALAEEPDVILMDIQMPVMGGIEAARRIRDHERLTGRAHTPIIALTANSMTHQVAEYRAAGISGLVAKPIQASALVEALIAAVEDAGAASA